MSYKTFLRKMKSTYLVQTLFTLFILHEKLFRILFHISKVFKSRLHRITIRPHLNDFHLQHYWLADSNLWTENAWHIMTHLWLHGTFLWSESQITLISGTEFEGESTRLQGSSQKKSNWALRNEFHNCGCSSCMAWVKFPKDPGETEPRYRIIWDSSVLGI